MLSQQSIEKIIARQTLVKARAERNQRNKQREKYFGNTEGIFPDVNKLTYEEAKSRLRNKLKGKIQITNINSLNYGNPQGLKHYVAKAILGYLLINHNHHFSSEVLETDLFWIERDFSIEIEKNYCREVIEAKLSKFRKCFNDVLIINLNELPEDINGIRDYLRYKIGL